MLDASLGVFVFFRSSSLYNNTGKTHVQKSPEMVLFALNK